MSGTTLFEKIWQSHMVRSFGERALIHIDRYFVHEGTSRNAFDGLRTRGRGVKNLELTFGVIDHDPSTLPGRRRGPTSRRANVSARCRRTVASSGSNCST
jgi:homoaconitase/3-isopropylmalate dehydratase large subunit